MVQRYGDGIVGGSEAHARQVAERLLPFADVQILTTCAKDYTTWDNFYPEGVEELNGVSIHRFPVIGHRHPDFNQLSDALFANPHSRRQEIDWLHAQGPVSPSLLDAIIRVRHETDAFIFFTYLYYTTALGLRLVPDKALLIPTAHDEKPIYLNIYKSFFHAPRGFIFNTEEERAFIYRLFGNDYIPNEIVGVGVDVPENPSPDRFRKKFGINGPYFLYMGRIVVSKGCQELIEGFQHYQSIHDDKSSLVLLGKTEMEIPKNPGVFYGGFVDEQDKFDAIAGCTAVLVPSRFESLSMIALEAWALEKPVVTTEFCTVVKGMCERSGGGLFYRDSDELAEILHLLISDDSLRQRLGEAGMMFVEQNYTWEKVVEKYRKMIDMVVNEKWA